MTLNFWSTVPIIGPIPLSYAVFLIFPLDRGPKILVITIRQGTRAARPISAAADKTSSVDIISPLAAFFHSMYPVISTRLSENNYEHPFINRLFCSLSRIYFSNPNGHLNLLLKYHPCAFYEIKMCVLCCGLLEGWC